MRRSNNCRLGASGGGSSSSRHSGATGPMLALLLFGLSLVGTAHAIECYTCSSSDPSDVFYCNEFLTEVDRKPCNDVYNAKHCVKQVGRLDAGIGTTRFCSAKDLGNYCTYDKLPGETMKYRSCVYTCSSDGCNTAATLSMSRLAYSLLPPLVLLGFGFVWRG